MRLGLKTTLSKYVTLRIVLPLLATNIGSLTCNLSVKLVKICNQRLKLYFHIWNISIADRFLIIEQQKRNY